MKLTLLTGEYSVMRLAATSQIPAWANQALQARNDFATIARTRDELSIVCQGGIVVAADVERVEAGWRAFRVAGQLEFEQVGIVAGLAQPLAAAGIPLFCVSTFDTDYILVKETNREQAEQAWRNAGHTVDSSLA